MVEPLLHAKEFSSLGLQQPIDGNACPGRDEAADLLGGDDHFRLVAGCPCRQSAKLLLESESLRSQFGGPFVIGTLGGGGLLVGEALDACLGLDELGRLGLGVDAQPRGRLIDEIDSLVWEQPVGDVSLAQSDGGFEGGGFDLDLVVGLVLWMEGLEHFDGDV